MDSQQPDSIPVQKARLRARFDRYRRSLNDEAYERLSHAIASRAAGLPEIRPAGVVHVYWPMIAHREVDTRSLIARFKSRGTEIVLPVVLNFNREGRPTMTHVRYQGADRMQTNRWGIAEPERRDEVELEMLEAVVVPALGAGRNGHRIGHGRGYYDAFLASLAVPKICLVYDACLVDTVPSEPHDVEMDVIVTEREIVRAHAV